MRLTLVQEQAITELAKHLYDFLPGQAHPYANQAVSFQGAAKAAHLDRYWQGGSKQPAIVALLRATLANKPESFCDLIKVLKHYMKMAEACGSRTHHSAREEPNRRL
jgi:hypothetical protein